jgi:hypothetical protein
LLPFFKTTEVVANEEEEEELPDSSGKGNNSGKGSDGYSSDSSSSSSSDDDESEKESEKENQRHAEMNRLLKERLDKEERRNASLQAMVDQKDEALQIGYRKKIDRFINKDAWIYMKAISAKNLVRGSLFMTKFLKFSQLSEATLKMNYDKICARIVKRFTDKRNAAVSEIKTKFEGMQYYIYCY